MSTSYAYTTQSIILNLMHIIMTGVLEEEVVVSARSSVHHMLAAVIISGPRWWSHKQLA